MKTIIPLCVPRSGSSTLAGVLYYLGVSMGSEQGLKKGKYNNKYGCYENQDFLNLSSKVLINSGILETPDLLIPKKHKLEKNVEEFKPVIKRVIKRNEKQLWGWKIPSAHYLMPYIHPFFKNPYYIYLKRDTSSVVKSYLNKCEDITHSYYAFNQFIPFFQPLKILSIAWKGLKSVVKNGLFFKNKRIVRNFIQHGYSNIEEFIVNKPFLTVKFDNLMNEPNKVVYELIDYLNISPSENQIRNALNFVQPELVHY